SAFDATCPNYLQAIDTNPWTLTINDVLLGDSTIYTVLAYAVDFAGNQQTPSAAGTFTYINNPPVTNAAMVSPTTLVEDITTLINLVYTDAEGENASTCTVANLSNVSI